MHGKKMLTAAVFQQSVSEKKSQYSRTDQLPSHKMKLFKMLMYKAFALEINYSNQQ
jgi:hypothetical protein